MTTRLRAVYQNSGFLLFASFECFYHSLVPMRTRHHEQFCSHLPVELINHILSFVGSKATLANAALCSKQWHDIAIAHLCRCVSIPKAREDSDMDFLGQSLVRMLLLLRKPLLAKLVRHFHIRPGLLELTACDLHARLEKTLREMSELTGNVGYEIKEGIAGLSRNELEHAGWRVEATVEDSLTAVLLPRLLNLEKLDIETGATPPSEFWVGRVVRRAGLREAAFGDAGVLAKLRSFLWAHEHGQTGGTLTEVGFVLPGLQNMFFHRIGTEAGDGSDERLARVQPRSSACTHLELKDCRFHDAALLRMVAIPRALKPFIYELGCGSIAKCRISFLAIRNALDMHKETLENIWITYPHSGIKFYRDADPSSGMKSLSHFPGLKRLRIAPDFIFGYELTATHAKEVKAASRFLAPVSGGAAYRPRR